MKVETYIQKIKKLKANLSHYDDRQVDHELNQLISARPERPGAYLFKVDMALRNKETEKAIQILKDAMSKCSDERILVQLVVLLGLTNQSEALSLAEKLYQKGAKNVDFLFSYANVLRDANSFKDAEVIFKECISLSPKHVRAINNLASLYYRMADYDSAEQLYMRALKLTPTDALICMNIGNVLVKKKDYQQAIQAYEKSIQINPSFTNAYFNIGQIYANVLSEKSKALDWYKKGIENGSGELKTLLKILEKVLKWQLIDWDNYQNEKLELHQLLESYLYFESDLRLTPYELSYCDIDPVLYRKIAEKYADSISHSPEIIRNRRNYNYSFSTEKIKVGYYSCNFKNHPGGLLVRKLFEYHDRSKFEIHAFHLSDSNDDITQDISDAVDYFHDISNNSNPSIADFINRLGIDVLVTLGGYNSSMRLEPLAFRPAPIQIMAIGSHETSGADFIDYVFSDTWMHDHSLAPYFKESIITLPCPTLCNSALPEMSANVTHKVDHGLPEESFVFASFNDPRKLNPNTLSLWIEILKKAEHSVLWIYGASEIIIENRLKSFFAAEGLGDRMIIAKKVPLAQHWERLRHANLMLDTLVFGAHFTAVEALRNDVPMITLRGKSHNSRITGSLLHFSGLDDLIADNHKEYIQKAVSLSQDSNYFLEVKRKLNNKQSLTFDSWRQIKLLEKAYLKAISDHEQKVKRPFKVGDSLPFDTK